MRESSPELRQTPKNPAMNPCSRCALTGRAGLALAVLCSTAVLSSTTYARTWVVAPSGGDFTSIPGWYQP